MYDSALTLDAAGKVALLIIDPQNDFHEGGSLAVPGAREDARRIADLIRNQGDTISEIFITLDTHQKLHIAHPMFWVDEQSYHPPPFTPISVEDVESGKWRTSHPQFQEWGLDYVKALERNKRFQLLIWPEHCLVGTVGHAVEPQIIEAVHEWEANTGKVASYILKGHHALAEHYSAIRADVMIKGAPSTHVNQKLVDDLAKFNKVVICGQALSHCVNFTTRDLADEFPPNRMKDLIILTDASSPVPKFEEAANTFLSDMQNRGLVLQKSTDPIDFKTPSWPKDPHPPKKRRRRLSMRLFEPPPLPKSKCNRKTYRQGRICNPRTKRWFMPCPQPRPEDKICDVKTRKWMDKKKCDPREKLEGTLCDPYSGKWRPLRRDFDIDEAI